MCVCSATPNLGELELSSWRIAALPVLSLPPPKTVVNVRRFSPLADSPFGCFTNKHDGSPHTCTSGGGTCDLSVM